jgi:UDP-glucose 4-epimerase
MRVFITGGSGFIGSHLVEKYLRQGDEVAVYDNLSLGRRELLGEGLKSPRLRFIEADLLDLDRLKRSIAGYDLVYHMAANSDISNGSRVTDVDLRNGTLATYSTLEAMRLSGVKRLVFASTSAIYGEAARKPTPEDYGPLFPISFYGASKLACEGLCSAFSHNHGIQVWAYRFANIVGPRSTHGAIHDFVARLLAAPEELRVLGDGSQRKSYLYVADCVAGMESGMLASSEPFQLFNLASSGVTNVKFIAEETVAALEPVTGVRARIIFGEGDRGWTGDVPYTHLDGSRLESLGWKASLESDAAVRRAIGEVVAEKASAWRAAGGRAAGGRS